MKRRRFTDTPPEGKS